MFRTMVTQLIHHERIKTTLPKAKALRRVADRAVTWAKHGDKIAHTRAVGFVRDRETVKKLFNTLGPRYKDRVGGYVRVLRAGFRTGDRAPMAILEYVDRQGEVRPARPAAPKPNRARPHIPQFPPMPVKKSAEAAAAEAAAAAGGAGAGKPELR